MDYEKIIERIFENYEKREKFNKENFGILGLWCNDDSYGSFSAGY
ncbi:hypothetical protein FACS1894198_6040 [Clostridia bacterium]|nr:hypothetical protein FACS1894198_6040 [Clostridia bacterium]